jgi:hypothetical protein
MHDATVTSEIRDLDSSTDLGNTTYQYRDTRERCARAAARAAHCHGAGHSIISTRASPVVLLQWSSYCRAGGQVPVVKVR